MSIRMTGVTKTFWGPDGTPVPVIDVPNLALDDGERIALIGTSGSGKTTLLHLIAGILVPDAGSINVGIEQGQVYDLARMREAQRDVFRGRHMGYIFQTHHLLPGLTALENVLLGMTFSGSGSDRGWARHLLEEVGLADRLNYRPGRLSVGQQQRVAVARAMANKPKIVLADEPTGALDAVSARQALDLILRLCAEVNAALVLVTHDLEIAGGLPKTLKLTDINRAAKKIASEAQAMATASR